jgi:L-aminopeptidase/D-esterase-like protein
MKGGLGIARADAGDVTVCALAVVNALGDVRDASGAIIAGARRDDGTWLDTQAFTAQGTDARFGDLAGRNTTLCVVSTNADVSRVHLGALARAASAALFRRITPVGTAFDGDIVFATAPHEGGLSASNAQVEALAVSALEIAIERAVRTRVPGDIFPG